MNKIALVPANDIHNFMYDEEAVFDFDTDLDRSKVKKAATQMLEDTGKKNLDQSKSLGFPMVYGFFIDDEFCIKDPTKDRWFPKNQEDCFIICQYIKGKEERVNEISNLICP